MTNNAGLYTLVPMNARLLANGMIHRSLAPNVVTMKLRELGLKDSPTRVFWKLVAMCIRHQTTTVNVLRDLSNFSPANVKRAHVGTTTLGLVCSIPLLTSHWDDVFDFPQHIPLPLSNYEGVLRCADHHDCTPFPRDEDRDEEMVLRIAVATALPPVGLLETVLLSLKEGDTLSDSMVRRLRRKDAEAKVAAAQGRAPVSESQRRKQKKKAAAALQASSEGSSDNETPTPAEYESAYIRPRSQRGSLGPRAVAPFTASIDARLFNVERRKVTAEDVEKLAASASRHRRTDCQ